MNKTTIYERDIYQTVEDVEDVELFPENFYYPLRQGKTPENLLHPLPSTSTLYFGRFYGGLHTLSRKQKAQIIVYFGTFSAEKERKINSELKPGDIYITWQGDDYYLKTFWIRIAAHSAYSQTIRINVKSVITLRWLKKYYRIKVIESKENV